MMDTLTATVISGVVANVLFHPLDTVRVIHQTAPVHAPGMYMLRPMTRYWQGLVPAVAFSVPAFAIDVGVYRGVKHTLGGDSLKSCVVAGAAAQLASSVLWTPMEILSGRFQLRDPAHKRSLSREITGIWREDGWRGFFRGYSVGLAIFLPYTVSWWVSYDGLKHHVGVPIASAIATGIGETFANIFCVVQTRTMLASAPGVAVLRPTDKLGAYQVLTNLVKEAGLGKALVRGLHIKLLTSIPLSAFSMTMLEWLSPDP